MRLGDFDALKETLHNFFDGKVIDEPAYILRDVFYHIDSAPTIPLPVSWKETTFDDYLKEQLKDPEFRKEWEKLCEEERHSPYDHDEEENVCNMKSLGCIDVHQSEQTGKIYITFILLHDKELNINGCWRDTMEIFPNEWDEIKKKLLSIIADEDGAK